VTKGEAVTSQVILDDGSESPLSDHLREVHQKGTRGLSEEFLASLHRTLHQPKREPQPEHEHPGDDADYGEDEALASA
jgi:hypothetical protein